jgi:hypothetical protein
MQKWKHIGNKPCARQSFPSKLSHRSRLKSQPCFSQESACEHVGQASLGSACKLTGQAEVRANSSMLATFLVVVKLKYEGTDIKCLDSGGFL